MLADNPRIPQLEREEGARGDTSSRHRGRDRSTTSRWRREDRTIEVT